MRPASNPTLQEVPETVEEATARFTCKLLKCTWLGQSCAARWRSALAQETRGNYVVHEDGHRKMVPGFGNPFVQCVGCESGEARNSLIPVQAGVPVVGTQPVNSPTSRPVRRETGRAPITETHIDMQILLLLSGGAVLSRTEIASQFRKSNSYIKIKLYRLKVRHLIDTVGKGPASKVHITVLGQQQLRNLRARKEDLP